MPKLPRLFYWATRVTFGEVAESWLQNVAKERNRSWKQQKRQLEIHIYPEWKDRWIHNLNRTHVHELLDQIEGAVLPNRILALVKTIFNYAVCRDWIPSSPAHGVAKRKCEPRRDTVLSMSELSQIWSIGNKLGYPFGFFIQLLLLSAQRRTEVASLRWDDLNFQDRTWTLRAAHNKSGRTHIVPLPTIAWQILKDVPRFGEFVFTSNARSHISGFSYLKKRIEALLSENQQADALPDWRFHDLRRSAATHMVRLGAREEVVSRVLNHAPFGITAKIYTLHSYRDEKEEALEMWADEIGRRCRNLRH